VTGDYYLASVRDPWCFSDRRVHQSHSHQKHCTLINFPCSLHIMSGFALTEYQVPKFGMPKQIFGGTMPKASGKYSSHLGQVEKQAAKTPGPGHYDLSTLDAKNWKSRGGKFVKCARDKGHKLNKTPPCSQYNVEDAKNAVMTKTPGGKLSKADRGSHLEDTAQYRSAMIPAPGKYDPKDSRKITTPSFSHATNSARSPGRVPGAPGPGHYKVQHDLCTPRAPMWAHDKAPQKTLLDMLCKDKAKLPAPGHCGIPNQTKVDQQGRCKHAKLLLESRDADLSK